MDSLPAKLRAVLDHLSSLADRAERVQALVDIAAALRPLPPMFGQPPFPEERRVPRCESGVFVWEEGRSDGTLNFHFAVQNPQGIAARAAAAILQKTLSGAPLAEVAALPPDLFEEVFGGELSTGKALGMAAMVNRVRALAAARLSFPPLKQD